MNVAYKGPWPTIAEHDALLMDVARRIQLSKTKHDTAVQNFNALCKHVDREGSPLEGKVRECYPSGSFATGTAIASRVAKNQHDVDVVIEFDISPHSLPSEILQLLFSAINGETDGLYHGKVTLHSRCVTVEYADGTTVDLMPVARIAGPPRAGHLFHHKAEDGESYHKPVNPWGFADEFNRRVEFDRDFYTAFQGRRFLVEGNLEIMAETQPMPSHVPPEEKSPRVVALQLIKRNRDIAFRASDRRHLRKPPSVVLNAIGLDAGPVQSSLLDEVISIASHIRARLLETNGPRGNVQVFNPSYAPDEFTDRWPENTGAQQLYDGDLRRLIVALHRLRNDSLSSFDKLELLKSLFGETAANYAIESNFDSRRHEMEAGQLHVSPTGKVLGVAAPAIVGTRTTPVKAATREGGHYLNEVD